MTSADPDPNFSGSGSVPAFVAKLWALVDDEATNELINWGVDGRSFHLFDHARFAKEILPLFFKHSNLSSFVRQLNMYGFRKVLNIEQGGLKVDREDMEFQHHFFVRGHPEMLPLIKRKVAQPNSNNSVAVMQQDALIERANMEEKVENLEMSLKMLQATQDVVNEQLLHIKRENGTLWQELAAQRQKHLKQQQVTHKLLQFIVHSVMPNVSGSTSRPRGSISLGKRKLPALMIDQAPKRAATEGTTTSASIDKALEVIEDVFDSPEVQTGPIIREIPLEVYEASVASNGQAGASTSKATLGSGLAPTVPPPVTMHHASAHPTFATALAEDGSTVLLMQTAGVSTGPTVPQVAIAPATIPMVNPNAVAYVVNSGLRSKPEESMPIITPADSPAEPRAAPSPAMSIHSVPSPASSSKSQKSPANHSVKPGLENLKTSVGSGRHPASKNLPLLKTSMPEPHTVGVSKAAETGETPEIIDTPTLTDFISQFPVMLDQRKEADKLDSRSIVGRTDPLGAAVLLSGVADDEDVEDAKQNQRPAESPSPRGLARSLSKQIDNVDAGLDSIKDMLVAQSPDLNMDPSDLLNLFMPDGPITTDPRTPIALDDLLGNSGCSPFLWPSVTSSTRGLPAPESKKDNELSTPRLQ